MDKLILYFVVFVAVFISDIWCRSLKNGNESRIVGGTDADIEDYSSTTSIRAYGPKGGPFRCGGALISDRYGIITASCVYEQIDIIVKFAVSDRDMRGFDKDVDSYEIHPYNDPETPEYDVAILKLTDDPIDFEEVVRPIEMVKIESDPEEDEIMVITGYSKTEADEGGPAVIADSGKLAGLISYVYYNYHRVFTPASALITLEGISGT